MYSLHIIDKLSSNNNGSNVKETTSLEKTEEKVNVENWNELFIKKGGLRLLYDIMMSGECMCIVYYRHLSILLI